MNKPLQPVNWTAGVHWDCNWDKNEDETEEELDDDEENYPDDDKIEEEECYFRIDQSKIDEWFAEPAWKETDNTNPTIHDNNSEESAEQSTEENENDGDEESEALKEPKTRQGRQLNSALF
jgi:hypothetical protein